MLKNIGFLFILLFTLNACVSKKVYQELETKYNAMRTSNASLIDENERIVNEKNQLQTNLETLQKEFDNLNTQKKLLEDNIAALQHKYNNLDESYQVLATQSSNRLAEQSKKNQDLLLQLEQKERNLTMESERLENLQLELNKRSEQINELQRLINEKELQMQALKEAISKALHNFEGKGLSVVHKNGKIYVSMENKLLFGSGSWAVGDKGKKAVMQLATVLNQNAAINVLIEGHTDNVPYNGNVLIDNWDLSVKRATAIVRILQSNGVNPTQITAAGRSEYLPVDSNATTEGKAKNRRIDIILAPNLDAISNILKE